jgi:WD40 repeat protein
MLVALGADGKRFVSVSEDEAIMQVWDVETGNPVGVPMLLREVHPDAVESVLLDPGGKEVFTESKDLLVRWDVETGGGQPISKHSVASGAVAVSAGWKRVVEVSEDGTRRVLDVKTRQPVGEPWSPFEGFAETFKLVALSPDGKKIVRMGGDGNLHVRDVSKTEEESQSYRNCSEHIGAIHT